MNRYYLLILFCVWVMAGCEQKLAENVKPDDAAQALRTAMEAWKEGKSRSDLESASPSIIMNEAEWSPEKQLVDYKMDDEGTLDGRQMRWVVQLKLKDQNGKVSDKKATYIIDTIPRIVIVRDQFAS